MGSEKAAWETIIDLDLGRDITVELGAEMQPLSLEPRNTPAGFESSEKPKMARFALRLNYVYTSSLIVLICFISDRRRPHAK